MRTINKFVFLFNIFFVGGAAAWMLGRVRVASRLRSGVALGRGLVSMPRSVSNSLYAGNGDNAEKVEKLEKVKRFRMPFHVPEKWSADDKFGQLFGHNYLGNNGAQAIGFVVETLREKGYLKNDRMVHDYLLYMISDLLASEGIPHITEDDIRAEPYLRSIFSDLTPDLIVKSSLHRRTTIVDIYMGSDKAVHDKKKSKYKGMAMAFDFIGVMELSMCRDLEPILSEASIDYLAFQFRIFKTEYQYWKSCAKLQRMLFRDDTNHDLTLIPLPLEVDDEFSGLKDKFLEALVTKAKVLLDDDDI